MVKTNTSQKTQKWLKFILTTPKVAKSPLSDFFFVIKNNLLITVSYEIVSLMVTRLVHSGHGSNNLQNEDMTFGTRTGTRKGVEAHMFRVETPRELANWSRNLVQGAHDAASLIKEINCGRLQGCLIKGIYNKYK